MISSSGSSHSGQVLVGPRKYFLNPDVFSVGIFVGGWETPKMVDWQRGINLLRFSFRKLLVPKYWHKFSPKIYEVWQHGVMLVFYRRYCDSYSEFVEWLPNTKLPEMIGLQAIPDEATLCREEKRLKPFLEAAAMMLVVSVLPDKWLAAADMTGLQTKRASPYYVRRIKASYSRRGYARLELVVWKSFIVAWELNLSKKDELAMLKSLWKKIKKKPSVLTYDKKGDCEPHHEWLESEGVQSIAPPRINARRGMYRKRLMRKFPQKKYSKRNRVENVNFVLKNKYGDALKAYSTKGRRAEVTTKILSYNLWRRLTVIIYELCNIAIL